MNINKDFLSLSSTEIARVQNYGIEISLKDINELLEKINYSKKDYFANIFRLNKILSYLDEINDNDFLIFAEYIPNNGFSCLQKTVLKKIKISQEVFEKYFEKLSPVLDSLSTVNNPYLKKSEFVLLKKLNKEEKPIEKIDFKYYETFEINSLKGATENEIKENFALFNWPLIFRRSKKIPEFLTEDNMNEIGENLWNDFIFESLILDCYSPQTQPSFNYLRNLILAYKEMKNEKDKEKIEKIFLSIADALSKDKDKCLNYKRIILFSSLISIFRKEIFGNDIKRINFNKNSVHFLNEIFITASFFFNWSKDDIFDIILEEKRYETYRERVNTLVSEKIDEFFEINNLNNLKLSGLKNAILKNL